MIELLRQAREFIATLVDKQPTMLLYDIGHTEERSDEELLSDDLEAIKERKDKVHRENELLIYSIVDEIMDKYGFGALAHNLEPYKIPLLNGDSKSSTTWLGSTPYQDLFPAGVKLQWMPWADNESAKSPTFGASISSSGYAQTMGTECHYCSLQHSFYSELPFSKSFYKSVLENDGWVESTEDGNYICPVCFIELFQE